MTTLFHHQQPQISEEYDKISRWKSKIWLFPLPWEEIFFLPKYGGFKWDMNSQIKVQKSPSCHRHMQA